MLRRRGFTLLEILIAVAIIALLLSLVGVVAVRMKETAKIRRCEAMIKSIHIAMETYKTVHWVYPSGLDDADSRTYPNPYDPQGVELDKRMVTERAPGATFSKGDFDPDDHNFFLDPWGRRIRYRKVSPERILIWSSGPDRVDDIGTDAAGRKERAGDDISQVCY